MPTPAAAEQPKPAPPVPKITLLLVLGHHFERLVREGTVRDYAEIARLTGLTRARVTQIVNLTLLAPSIQEGMLSRGAEVPDIAERLFRPLTPIPEWHHQRKPWESPAQEPTPSPARIEFKVRFSDERTVP